MGAVAFLIVLAAVAVYVAFTSRQAPLSDRQQQVWQSAIDADGSQAGRALLRVARPLSSSKLITDAAESPTYRALAQRITGAGGVFAGSVEVFLAVQAFCVFLSVTALLVTVVVRPDGLMYLMGVLLAVGVAAYPYNLVSKKASERAEDVDVGLPEFAELLQMPLSTGMGVVPALAFTAERLSGPVADETRRLVQVIGSKSLPDAEAFRLAGARIGTPEAQALFNSCMQAHLQGSPLIDTLGKQAEALRFSAYQRSRAKAKRLPVKLVLIMALHFIPTLLIIVLIPGAIALGSI